MKVFNYKHKQTQMLKVKLHSPNARAPTQGTKGSAGYDLYSPIDCIIPARSRLLIQTDISVRIPEGHYGQVASRSSLSLRNGLEVGAGVIDESYTGILGIILHNFTDVDYSVKMGDRIGQLILIRISVPDVEIVEDLGSTDRGEGGFGSTGK